MSKDLYKFVEPFLNADGISGYEHEISEVYMKSAKASGAEIDRDGFGSVIAKMGTKGPKLMIASHMDEVGFLVRGITKKGLLKVSPVGGHWPHAIIAMEIKVKTREGKEFYGVVGSTSVHVLTPAQRTKVMDMKDVFVDVGFNTEQEVLDAGIEIGDQVIRVSKARLLGDGDKFMAKAVDNRISVALVAKVLENLKGAELDHQLFAVATVQEEVGLRGAKASTQHIQPDVAIALDTIVSHDTPGIIEGGSKLGDGVAIAIKDNSAIANPVLANLLFDLGKKHNIPVYKFVSMGGGNDAGVLQYGQGGIPVVSIGIPTRYLHTPYEVGSLKDGQAVVDLLTEFLKTFNDADFKKLAYKK